MADSFLTADSWNEILETLQTERTRLREESSPARVLLDGVLDSNSTLDEIGGWAGRGIYSGSLKAASNNLLCGIGRISEKTSVVIASADRDDSAPFPPTLIRRIDRVQQIALENQLPVLYVVSSSGRYQATDEEQFPDQHDWGRLTAGCSRLRAEGVFQATVSLGKLNLDGPLAPLAADAMVLAGDSDFSSERAPAGSEIVDCRRESSSAWSDAVRRLFGALPAQSRPLFGRRDPCPPAQSPESIYDIMPRDPSYEYETRQIIERLADADSFVEYKAEYGRTLVCGYARLDGWTIGIMGNQKQHVHQPQQPIEVGGVIYPASADKGARFVLDCNQNRLPLLFLQDVNGFMVGREVEIAGIIRSGAKLVNAVANSVVPKITVVMGGSYGAGNYALCGRGYQPRFLYAWPTCRYAVMGGAQAARTLLALRVRQLERAGDEPDESTLQSLSEEIQNRYDEQLDPRYAAARLWVDDVIAPHETRHRLSRSLEAIAHCRALGELKTGVLQV